MGQAETICIIGGGASGISAASMAKRTNPDATVICLTEFEDVAYSPCGIPYVLGKEIPEFERLFLAGPEQVTLPRQMFTGIRENISPTIAAVATLLILFTTALMLTLEWLRGRRK